jgi:AmmeMemoRadiSam system protein B
VSDVDGARPSAGRPRLRPGIDAVPVEHDGQTIYLLKDPLKLSERQVGLPLGGVLLVGLFDGARTTRDVQAEFARRHGVEVALEHVDDLAAALEGALLLEGPGLARVLAAFAREPVRAPACIGSYPGEPPALRAFLEAQWGRAGGPGAPPRPASTGRVRGIVSPHIDLHRGGHAYAHAWRAVAEECPAELFVVFGTSHTGTSPLDGGDAPRFALTRKHFDTPLGQVPCDRDVVDRLVAGYDGPDDLFAGEWHHRGEHSIEFQTVWLAHLFGGRRPVRVLPVLCGSLHDLVGPPSSDGRLVAFHRALRAALAPLAPERVAFVAGIDLAHVGAQFGAEPVSEDDVNRVEVADRGTLALVTDTRDPDRVHQDIMADGDARSICGHAPLVAMLQALEGQRLEGDLLHYGRWHDGKSAVSFASAVLRA